MKKDYTHICIVLDASGSMTTLKSDVIGMLRNFCAKQREAEKQGETIYIDAYQFSGDVKRLAHNAGTDTILRMMERYDCAGSTALNDAVCRGIDELGAFFAKMREEDRPEDVLFVIVTDGHENASRKFTSEDVKKRIVTQRDVYNWKFLFIANGLNLNEVQRATGMRSEDVCEFRREKAQEDLLERCAERMETIRSEREQRRRDG